MPSTTQDRLPLRFGDRLIGAGHPCFVIAEAGVNHNGSLELAHKLVDYAAEAEADAVKFQTFRATEIATANAGAAAYQERNLGESKSQLEILKDLELSEQDHHALFRHCQDRGIQFMSTPFDKGSADLLQALGVEVFKLPSGEITNLPLLTHVAKMQRPLIVSTGMSRLGEVEEAVHAIAATGNEQFALLHCVSDYPADPADVNLRAMATMQTAFGKTVGYSDHTMGNEVSIAAVAMGACIIEKHFTLDRSLPGPDHKASSEPEELKALVSGIRRVESALGSGIKRPTQAEHDTARVARKSLVTATEIPAGTRLTAEMIAIKRPGSGLPPGMKPHFLNRKTHSALPAGHLLMLDDIS